MANRFSRKELRALRKRTRVSNAGIAEGLAGAVNATAIFVSTVVTYITKDPLWLGLGVGSGVITGTTTAAITYRNKVAERAKNRAAVLSRPITDSYTPIPGEDRRSYQGKDLKVAKLVGFIGGSPMKGAGSDERPIYRIKRGVEQETRGLMEPIDVALTGSGLGDLSRQHALLHQHVSTRFNHGHLDTLVIALGYKEIGEVDPPYGIEDVLRPILNELTEQDPDWQKIRNVPRKGVRVVIAPPNYLDDIDSIAEANEFKVPKAAKKLWRDRSEAFNKELDEFISAYKRDKPERAHLVESLSQGRGLSHDPKYGLYLSKDQLQELEGKITSEIIDTFKKNDQKKSGRISIFPPLAAASSHLRGFFGRSGPQRARPKPNKGSGR